MFVYRILDLQVGLKVVDTKATENGGQAKKIERSLKAKASKMNQEIADGRGRFVVDFNFV